MVRKTAIKAEWHRILVPISIIILIGIYFISSLVFKPDGPAGHMALTLLFLTACSGYLIYFCIKEGIILGRVKRENMLLNRKARYFYRGAIKSLSLVLEAKDRYYKGHDRRVTLYAMAMARELGLSKEHRELIYYVGLLHDIGKIGVSDCILTKTGRLTEEDWNKIKKHPEIGEIVVTPMEFLKEAGPIIRHHHERYDGSGYPDGLSGEHIPIVSRILAVADAYDAMTSTRPYRKTLTHEGAVAELKKNSGTQFDPKVMEAFLQSFARPHTNIGKEEPIKKRLQVA